jgi:hypothetical protein
MSEHRKGDRVVGSCWACGGGVRASEVVRLVDPAVGIKRKLHRGDCAARAEVMFGRRKGNG